MLQLLSDALIPVFVGLLLGYVMGRTGAIDARASKPLVTFVVSLAVPCALFVALARTPFRDFRRDLGSVALLVSAVGALYVGTVAWCRRHQGLTRGESAVVALTVASPNSAAIGLPLAIAVLGPQAAVAAVVSVAVIAFTVAPATVLVLESVRCGSAERVRPGVSLEPIWHAVRSPLVIAPVLGLIFSAFEIHLPGPVDRSLSMLAAAADGSALVMTGLVVSAQRIRFGRATWSAVVVKNLVQPALALAMALLMGLSADRTREVVVLCALPSGFFGLVIGQNFGVSSSLASSGVIASYLAGAFTLTGWIVVIGHLH